MSSYRDRGQVAARGVREGELWAEHGFALGPWVVGGVVGMVGLLSVMAHLLG